MKMFIKKFASNFVKDKNQVNAYFKCTTSTTKTLILERMDPLYFSKIEIATNLFKAFDMRFYDYNKAQNAKTAYYKLKIGSMTYA